MNNSNSSTTKPNNEAPSFPSYTEAYSVDPTFASDFAKLEIATQRRGALTKKMRALVGLALSSSIGLMDREAIRFYARKAIENEATHGEIIDTLRLTSVLGVHGYVMGVESFLELYSLDDIKQEGGEDLKRRALAARTEFERLRGYWVDAWERASWMGPEFVEAYASYSSRPHLDQNLAKKDREIIYTAIDFFPTMQAGPGGKGHMTQAIAHGATKDEILEVLEMVATFGFLSSSVGLPIAAEEWERAQKITEK
ncbi:MAG: carboxymuconolactone decarboxylase family protein [Alphaproteobacteria bacterium]|nr:carboxymuconolactone decarboxylase family protein [Alphaproteobacteria bacterium]